MAGSSTSPPLSRGCRRQHRLGRGQRLRWAGFGWVGRGLDNDGEGRAFSFSSDSDAQYFSRFSRADWQAGSTAHFRRLWVFSIFVRSPGHSWYDLTRDFYRFPAGRFSGSCLSFACLLCLSWLSDEEAVARRMLMLW